MEHGIARFFGWLQASFIIIGSVVGAGFISGGELVFFFPTSNFLPYVYCGGILFFLYFALLLACGKRYGGFEGVLTALFKRYAPAVRAVFMLCCFIICATMLAGIDSVFWEAFGISKKFPAMSISILIAVFFISRKGIGAIGKVNFILVPAILLFVMVFSFAERGTEYGFSIADGSRGLQYTVLYVCMNAFLAAPVACDLGKEAPSLPVSFTAAFFIAFCAALILGVICKEGANALGADMPLLYVVTKRGATLGKVFSVVCLFGIVTTLFSSYYPLHTAAEKLKKRELFRACVCLGAILTARVGLKGIIGHVYPALGIFGLVFGVICAVRLCSDGSRSTACRKEKRNRPAR